MIDPSAQAWNLSNKTSVPAQPKYTLATKKSWLMRVGSVGRSDYDSWQQSLPLAPTPSPLLLVVMTRHITRRRIEVSSLRCNAINRYWIAHQVYPAWLQLNRLHQLQKLSSSSSNRLLASSSLVAANKKWHIYYEMWKMGRTMKSTWFTRVLRQSGRLKLFNDIVFFVFFVALLPPTPLGVMNRNWREWNDRNSCKNILKRH